MFTSREDAPDWAEGYDSVLWPDPDSGPWLLKVAWAMVSGRYECVGLEIRSYRTGEADWPVELPGYWANPPTLTASILRRVPVGELVSDLRREIAQRELQLAKAFDDSDAVDPEDAAIDADLALLARQQSAAWGDRPKAVEGHQEVANIYAAAWRDGRPPTKAVAAHFTISASAAAKRVARAREAGFLPQTRQGMAEAHREDT